MSGTADTSQPSDRLAFDAMVTGGGPIGGRARSVFQAVANCQAPMADLTGAMLGAQPGQTYAQGAALILARWAQGRAGW